MHLRAKKPDKDAHLACGREFEKPCAPDEASGRIASDWSGLLFCERMAVHRRLDLGNCVLTVAQPGALIFCILSPFNDFFLTWLRFFLIESISVTGQEHADQKRRHKAFTKILMVAHGYRSQRELAEKLGVEE